MTCRHRSGFILSFSKSAQVRPTPAVCATETRGLRPRQPGSEAQQSSLVTALLWVLISRPEIRFLSMNHKTLPKTRRGLRHSLPGRLPASGRDLASLQGESTPCGSSSGCSGFSLHVWESGKVVGQGRDVVTEAGRPASLGHSVGKASAPFRAFCVSRVKPRKLGHLLSFQAPFQK